MFRWQCFPFHDYGKWEPYVRKMPSVWEGRQCTQTETRQRRICAVCGYMDDEKIAAGDTLTKTELMGD